MENKKKLTEEDIKNRYITPAIEQCGWKKEQMRMEFLFTDGRVIPDGKKGKRGVRKKTDYLLYYKTLGSNLPLAIVEAKDNKHTPTAGIQQAQNYAAILDVPFVFSSNGDSFVEYDRKTGIEKEIPLDRFPSPEELWQRFKSDKQITEEQENIITQPYYYKQGDKTPRYYQQVAINRTIEAIAQDKKRLLLVMATGTGKTYTAFQIIHRLMKSGTMKKVLYLADRNILIDQTMQQDFKPFKKIMTKVENRELDSSYQLYMSLYQQLAGDENQEPFRQFQPTFFDFIIVDECHRGSARDESRWRKILNYFTSAVQLGMTATPKIDDNVNTFDYFGGKPIYTYTLKKGIDDGFLAPYKVIRSLVNVDDSWRPYKGMLDENGEEIEDREYNLKDYDKNIILKDRTEKVARRITEWLKQNGRMSKAIVFCVGVNHADRMRQELGNLNADLKAEDDRYVMRITGDDNEGKKQLEYFIDEDCKYPVIATTSKLMTTGVDCKTVKLIVLDNNINSMTEFKQIIGRGTRLKTNKGKWFFTILDFRGNSRLFADPSFDGEPDEDVEDCEICGQYPCICPCTKCGKSPCECLPATPPTPPEPPATCSFCGQSPCICNVKPYICRRCGQVICECPPSIVNETPVVGKGRVQVEILQERVQYLDSQGKLITESITDYSKRNIRQKYETLSTFLTDWTDKERRKSILEVLDNTGVTIETLREQAGKPDMDDFDLLCHIAYDKKPLTKAERVNHVRKTDYLNKYEGMAREVLSTLLDMYADKGIDVLDDVRILEVDPFRRIGRSKIVTAFGGIKEFDTALQNLRAQIFAA